MCLIIHQLPLPSLYHLYLKGAYILNENKLCNILVYSESVNQPLKNFNEKKLQMLWITFYCKDREKPPIF